MGILGVGVNQPAVPFQVAPVVDDARVGWNWLCWIPFSREIWGWEQVGAGTPNLGVSTPI